MCINNVKMKYTTYIKRFDLSDIECVNAKEEDLNRNILYYRNYNITCISWKCFVIIAIPATFFVSYY